MTPLRQQMIDALQLSDRGERAQEAYVREVHLLAQFYHKSPDVLSEQELRHSYPIHLLEAGVHPRLIERYLGR